MAETDAPTPTGVKEPPKDSPTPSEPEKPNSADETQIYLHDLGAVVAHEVEAENAFVGNVFNVKGSVTIGQADSVRIPAVDITARVDATENLFVEPLAFPTLLAALRGRALAILVGPTGVGKRTFASVALRRAGHAPILQLPADVAIRDLVGSIEHLCERHPRVGILVESFDSTSLSDRTDFEIHRLLALLQSHGGAVVFTAKPHEVSATRQVQDLVVETAAPDARAVVSAAASARTILGPIVSTALTAIDELPGPVGPGVAIALLNAAVQNPQDAPERIMKRFTASHTNDYLDAWLSGGQPATSVAALAAAAALEGVSADEVHGEALSLGNLLSPLANHAAAKEFTPMMSVWPTEGVRMVQRTVNTHFGSQLNVVVEIIPPHNRERVLTYLCRLGPEFRRPFFEWLRGLPAHPRLPMRVGAAITAGILFSYDPLTCERELLRPWALLGNHTHAACAGLALGVPAAGGKDSSGSRALAKTWATGPDSRLRLVAVLAYGGLLGAWDASCAAPMHLWRIGNETPDLEREANLGLATLVSAAGEAARIRATVIDLLSVEAVSQHTAARAFRVLPLIFNRIAESDDSARDSLTSIRVPEESKTWASLVGLLARAFLSPIGRESAWESMRVLIRAARPQMGISEEFLAEVIRALKQHAPAGSRRKVGFAVQHALSAHTRSLGPQDAAVAQRLSRQFFSVEA